MNAKNFDIAAALIFAASLAHVFLAPKIHRASRRFPALKPFGETELVFAFWAVALLATQALIEGPGAAFAYASSRHFAEPAFVFVAIAIAGSRPTLAAARAAIERVAAVLPWAGSFYFSCLIVGPMLGSFITEPAAMAVTALLLRDHFADRSARFRYLTLAVLFVNVSVGGTLTNFAAPPVLMVAKAWNWTTLDMLRMFGWKAAVAVVVNASIAAWIFRAELRLWTPPKRGAEPPLWAQAANILLLAAAAVSAQRPVFFLLAFAAFAALAVVAPQAQGRMKWREASLVALFLAGLVVLGGAQTWWLQPALVHLGERALFVGSAALTAAVDNAALTYLGSQIDGLSEVAKYALVAGAVSGGGLTLIANAPNPAGFAILRNAFARDGFNPVHLLGYALAPTLVAMACFWLL